MTSRRDLVCIKFWLLTQFSLDLLNSFEPPSMFDLPTQIKKFLAIDIIIKLHFIPSYEKMM